MRGRRGLYLSLIFALAWIFMEPIWVTSLCCDCCYLTETDIEQFHWMKEADCFLYGDDCCYCAFGPCYYGTPVHNQTIGNGTANYWLNEANKLYLTGYYEQAAASYAKAVKLDPSSSEGWLNIGNALFFLSRYQESLNAYDTVLNTDPQNANAFLGKGQALLALNRTDEANAALNMARELQDRKILELELSKYTAGSTVEPVVLGNHSS